MAILAFKIKNSFSSQTNMKSFFTKKRLLISGLAITIMIGFGLQGNFFSADILFTEKARKVADNSNVDLDTAFDLWYIEDKPGVQDWAIPDVGGIAELPLGIVNNLNDAAELEPIDSVEFQLLGVPSFLRWKTTSTFEGFHVDTEIREGNNGSKNISLYIAPEEYTGPGANPSEGDPEREQLLDLIRGAAETLRVNFEVVSAPPLGDTSQLSFSINAILTARDGDFTRYKIGTRIGNIGTVHIVPLEMGPPQVVTTTATTDSTALLEFNVPVLEGSSTNGSERYENYTIYKCGSNVPAPISDDPNADDARSCRNMTQGSVVSPWEPKSAIRSSSDFNHINLTTQTNSTFVEGVWYIVLVSNVADETGRIENSMPVEGIFSQMFQWKPHPLVANIASVDKNTVRIIYSENVCPASQSQTLSAKNIANYEIFACNTGTDIEKCLEKNDPSVNHLTLSEINFDGEKTVTLSTSDQEKDAWYIARIRNVADANCEEETSIPDDPDPAYYTNQFQGFNPDSGKLMIGLSGARQLHLPWREKMYFSATGGTPPYTWEVTPEDAGTLDFSDSDHIVFIPRLKDGSNQAIHDERDVVITLTDVLGETYEVPVHILRRGDLGGEDARFLDHTDTLDLNDVSAGWRR